MPQLAPREEEDRWQPARGRPATESVCPKPEALAHMSVSLNSVRKAAARRLSAIPSSKSAAISYMYNKTDGRCHHGTQKLIHIYLFRNFLMVREKRTKCPKTNTLANRANIAKNILYHKQTNNTKKQTENIYSARHACGTVWAQGASAPCLQGLG